MGHRRDTHGGGRKSPCGVDQQLASGLEQGGEGQVERDLHEGQTRLAAPWGIVGGQAHLQRVVVVVAADDSEQSSEANRLNRDPSIGGQAAGRVSDGRRRLSELRVQWGDGSRLL